MKRILAGLACALMAATTMSQAAPAHASTTYTRAQLTSRATTLQFSTSLAKFISIRAKHSGIDTRFTWATNGCSASWKGMSAPYSSFFYRSCVRHDFGYRNFGHGLALGANDATKLKIDQRLLSDMYGQCSAAGRGSACRGVAYTYYKAIRVAGSVSNTDYYAGQCQAGLLCAFDDAGYKDRRAALTKSVSDFNTINFGDKTSSVKNASKVAWVLYDDHGYSDTHYCIKPGHAASNLGSYGFNDKTSSAKRLSTSSCSGYKTVG